MPRPEPLIFTVGHSTRSIEALIALLRAYGVKQLIDVRAFPRSRQNPQFNIDSLPLALQNAGISYMHLRELGGRRRAQPGSPNTGWRNASFRGYADYMQTPEFAASLERLIDAAKLTPSAIMCAEAIPWRCHRSLIADALIVSGFRVEEIISETRSQPHKLTPFAKVRGSEITYPLTEPIKS